VIEALLLAAQVAGPVMPAADTRTQTVFVSWDRDAKACVPQVNGVETGPISTDAGKGALVAAVPDKGAFVRLIGKDGFVIPYDCVADIGAALRHAGFYGRIGSISEPTSPRR
jgi:hypothetical protein